VNGEIKEKTIEIQEEYISSNGETVKVHRTEKQKERYCEKCEKWVYMSPVFSILESLIGCPNCNTK